MKCFISGKYSVILPWPLPMEAEKGRRWWCPWAHLGFLLPETAPLPVSTLKAGPQSLWRLFTASKGDFNLADSGSFFKATLNCWRTRFEFEILVEFEFELFPAKNCWLQGRLEVDLRLDGKLFEFEDLQSEVVAVVELHRSLVWDVQSNSEEPENNENR